VTFFSPRPPGHSTCYCSCSSDIRSKQPEKWGLTPFADVVVSLLSLSLAQSRVSDDRSEAVTTNQSSRKKKWKLNSRPCRPQLDSAPTTLPSWNSPQSPRCSPLGIGLSSRRKTESSEFSIRTGYPSDWKERLAGIKAINWSKKNRDWENVCMVANSVVANRQARVATKAYLKRKLGLPVSESEQHSIGHFIARSGSSSDLVSDTASASRTESSTLDFTPPPPRRHTIHPTEVRIGATVLRVNRSVQIPVALANWILQQGQPLRTIPNFVHETNAGVLQAAQPKRLQNGMYIDVHGDQKEMVRRGRRLLDACGFREVTFQVVLENGDVL
jgi:hypothetical protein